MKPKELIDNNGGLTDEERARADELVQAYEGHFAACGVEVTPPVAVLTELVVVPYIHMQRLEGLLAQAFNATTADTKNAALLSLLEAAGKTQERVRKAMKELEEYCAKVGTPMDAGLADIMKPILKRADGVLEDALEFESRKERRRAELAATQTGGAQS